MEYILLGPFSCVSEVLREQKQERTHSFQKEVEIPFIYRAVPPISDSMKGVKYGEEGDRDTSYLTAGAANVGEVKT